MAAILNQSFADPISSNQNPSSENFTDNDLNFYLDNKKLSQENLLVVQVNVGNFLLLDEPIIGYTFKDQVFLSLKDFIAVLELPITFADNLTASGWFINEGQIFSMDLRKNQVLSNNKKFTPSQKELIVFGDDVFVDINTLKKWFGLELSFNLQDLLMIVNSGGLLPIEKRFERQKEWQKLEEQRARQKEVEDRMIEEEKQGEVLKDNYKLASIPFGDLNYVQNYSKSKTGSTSASNLNALFSGDFLYLNNQLFVSATEESLTGIRLISGKKDAEGKLLGPLQATEFSLGDVFTPEIPLAARSSPGKGASISNYPLEYVNQFNKVLIRGNAQPTYDVELYRNDSLLNFQKVSDNGLYEFIDVPLVSGLNIIRLVFYGPSGQRYEETRKFVIGNDLLKENKLYYRFAANKNNEDLIDVRKQTEKNQSEGVGRFFGEVGYGLTKSTSLVANFLRAPIDVISGEQSNYAGLSLRSSAFGVSGRLDNVRDLKTQLNAQELSLQTLFFKEYNFTTEIEKYDEKFVSESHPFSLDPLLNKTIIRLDGPLKIPFMDFPSRISLVGTRQNFDSKEYINDLENEISFGLTRKLGLTENIKYTEDSKIDGEQGKIINGRTLMSYLFTDKLSIRSTLAYDLKPDQRFTSLDISTSYNFAEKFNTSAAINHQFSRDSQDGVTGYTASISRIFDKFLLNLGGNYSDNGSYGANLNLSTSFGYDQKNNVGIISGTPIANTGAIAAKVFLDDNSNKIYDDGEEVFKDIEVAVNNGARVKTNDQGVAFIYNLQLNGVSKVSINSDSLPDPYLVVRKKMVKVVAHSGAIINIDFPISKVGEISGYVATDKTDAKIGPASNVELELVDKDTGKVVYNVTSGYDGFYLFEMIPFGKYQVRISPSQSKRLGFAGSFEHDVQLDNNSEKISDANFIINYKVIPPWTQYKTNINKFEKPKSQKFKTDSVGKADNAKTATFKIGKPKVVGDVQVDNVNLLDLPKPKIFRTESIQRFKDAKSFEPVKIEQFNPPLENFNFKKFKIDSIKKAEDPRAVEKAGESEEIKVEATELENKKFIAKSIEKIEVPKALEPLEDKKSKTEFLENVENPAIEQEFEKFKLSIDQSIKKPETIDGSIKKFQIHKIEKIEKAKALEFKRIEGDVSEELKEVRDVEVDKQKKYKMESTVEDKMDPDKVIENQSSTPENRKFKINIKKLENPEIIIPDSQKFKVNIDKVKKSKIKKSKLSLKVNGN